MITTRVLAPNDGVLASARAVADQLPIPVDLDELVLGRAALLGLASRGRTSAGGSCRLLETLDGWVAVSLPRTSDVLALPAIVESSVDTDDPWSALEWFASTQRSVDVADRCQLLGVAGAVLDDPQVRASAGVTTHRVGAPATQPDTPLVIDLSSMWAGPLCARLLGLTGMHVIKVESTRRPDGARAGDPRFFAWLHDGHESRTLDFDDPAGLAGLHALIERADIVIEASRPRALAQLGIDAERWVAEQPGRTWVSITGYGRYGDAAQKVAFGDDAAVAGGLVGQDQDGLPVFCGDAIADPMTGLFAASATYQSVRAGGGDLLDISMASVAKSLAKAAG